MGEFFRFPYYFYPVRVQDSVREEDAEREEDSVREEDST